MDWINWRPALGWESEAIERAYRQALERDTEQLAGLLAEDPYPRPVSGPRPGESLVELTGGML